ncbi:hypothetical protein [Nocardia higoensis]|uniref:hypothetical protein n=1 Tax=Nocardia higoensis TaxID=228599 RepID=UPI0002F43675|nr:hypothetical protein [Nocardia higoensis]
MVAPGTTILDDDTVAAVREILDDPALPVDTAATGAGGVRAAALREAIDHLVSVRALATAGRDPRTGSRLLAELAALGDDLAAALAPHVTLTGVFAGLPAGRSRNAVLGDIGRGAVLTAATDVRSRQWRDGRAPDARQTLAAFDAELVVEDFPGLFDHIVVPLPDPAALLVLPTHRDRIGWQPLDPAAAGTRTRWLVRLKRVTVHIDELVPFDGDLPAALAG